MLPTGMILAFALALAIGLTRVVLGIHWSSGVIARWCAGIAWVTCCILISGGGV